MSPHSLNPHPHPIPDIVAILRRRGRLPASPSGPVARIESLPAEQREAALVAEGIVSEEDIAQTIARDTGLSHRAINAAEVSPEVVTGILPAPYARRNAMCALSQEGDTLTVAVANPYRRSAIVELERYLGIRVRVVVATRSDISSINGSLYNLRTSLVAAATELEDENAGGPDETGTSSELVSGADEMTDLAPTTRPVVSALDSILRQAFEHRASDIHMEPKRDNALVRFRVDGVLHDMHTFPRIVYRAVVSRLKMLSGLDIAEKRRPQDGRLKRIEPDREIELRVSTIPTVFGEKAVLRIFDSTATVSSLEQMHLAPDEQGRLEAILGRREGLVLVTGPTGSGKTTTLYSVLRHLATPEVNVISIEDPVELVHPQLTQVQVNPRIDLNFAAAIRSVLRQDPDIVMVGEIRDGETAEMAVQAALTGHLVLSTLHTNDAASTVTRLSDLGVPRFLIASTLIGVIAQRLVRTVCARCVVPARISRAEARRLDGPSLAGRSVRRGSGCARCRQSGYRGRRGVFEILPVEAGTAAAISRGATSAEIAGEARRRGSPSLRQAALRRLLAGETTVREVIRVTGGAGGNRFRSGTGSPGDQENQARNQVENGNHIPDGEPPAANGKPGEPPGGGQRNPADRRDRIDDEDRDQVEQQMDDRNPESPVGIDAGDRERREEGGDRGADVRAQGDRERILEQQQARSGERHQSGGGDRTGLDQNGGDRTHSHREDRALPEHPVNRRASPAATDSLERAHQQHEAQHQQGGREEGEHTGGAGTGSGDLAGDPGKGHRDQRDDIRKGVREGSAGTDDPSQGFGDSGGQPAQQSGQDLEREQDHHRHQVEHVVAGRHFESPPHGIGVGDVAKRDQGVGNGGSDIRPHHHRDRALEGQRRHGRCDQGHDEGAGHRRALHQRGGEDTGQKAGNRILEGGEERVQQIAAETLETLPEAIDPPEEEKEQAREGERLETAAIGGGGQLDHTGRRYANGKSAGPEGNPGPPIFEFED